MYYANLTFGGVGSEQYGCRPVLILQNNFGNKHSRTVIVAAITGKTESKAKIPTHCLVKMQNGLDRDSLVLLEQIRTIDKTRLRQYIGTLDDDTMNEVDRALAISVGLACKNIWIINERGRKCGSRKKHSPGKPTSR